MTNFIFYHYDPILIGAVIASVLFLVITILYVVQLARYKAWFTLPLIVGGLFEAVAYVSRCISHFNTQSMGPYVIASIFALVAPALFAASIYMILGRIIRVLGAEHHSLIRVNFLTKIFVIGDIVTFQIQSAGAGLQADKKPDSQHFGQILIVGALFLQIVIFCLFMMVAFIFNARIRKQPTSESQSSLPWQRHMRALYTASVLILVRNIVRTIEYILGTSGYINTHEAFLYAFDAIPMFGVMVLMAGIYAPTLLRQARHSPGGKEAQTDTIANLA